MVLTVVERGVSCLCSAGDQPAARFCFASCVTSVKKFRRIIGYRDLAKLVIAVERHALHAAAAKDPVHQQLAEPVTV